ncbi:MAG: phosphoheptose isomerase [Candidatus Accumulibacter phosphatis]|jgi:D-sedoheptulose 7-phosphate isomerase|uniref:Phosphoheptose isomerase n=2 Tax=Candidatus Accumulibacter TaxID=327159 RepID=A0A080LYJ4_9PROT|nr:MULTISPECIES: phosphoheptose isomerase [Candidatus Accumulibacter]KFB73826.1 MAG: Phosphoheptose isomerase [Candidatus Accumulibacter phosphatis]MBL8408148.1 phosphoheptose isomerase [Accumulibacter sp.]NMQ06227.1 phosphoheptose isomerase [Candidatus Accumulibacter contiguus]HRF11348.1 phosphoheptose isomerase [Candidatus Accumulibacter phosphatis]
MDLISRISGHFTESAQTKLEAVELLAAPIAEAIEAMVSGLLNNGKILACGNGGSAADAQHLAAELVGRFELERHELAAIALTTDTSVISAIANDYGYKVIFAKQVRALGQPGDILVAISTSGDSANVIEAINAAHENDLRIVALTGKGGGTIGEILRDGDVHICVPAERTARIQEIHLLIIHCLCDGIDCLLMGVEE